MSDFLWSSNAGFGDFIILVGVCCAGLLSRKSRAMALMMLVSFLVTRTAMTLTDVRHDQAGIFFVASGLSFVVTMAFARGKTEQVFGAFYIAIMATHMAFRHQLISWGDMTSWWVVWLTAQQIIVLGGAAHGGLSAMAARNRRVADAGGNPTALAGIVAGAKVRDHLG